MPRREDTIHLTRRRVYPDESLVANLAASWGSSGYAPTYQTHPILFNRELNVFPLND